MICLDTTNRGYQFFFRDGSRLPLIRLDVSGLDPFLVGVGGEDKEVQGSKIGIDSTGREKPARVCRRAGESMVCELACVLAVLLPAVVLAGPGCCLA